MKKGKGIARLGFSDEDIKLMEEVWDEAARPRVRKADKKPRRSSPDRAAKKPAPPTR
jgi:hypothetical protein